MEYGISFEHSTRHTTQCSVYTFSFSIDMCSIGLFTCRIVENLKVGLKRNGRMTRKESKMFTV